MRNLKPFGFLATASSRRPLAARMDGVSKIFPIHYDATSPTSKEKGQPKADFVVAMLGNSPKMRHDVA